MPYRGRFAPSPTGALHFGSLVAALAGWLCARHAGGEWLLRVEDIDPPREVPGSAAAILAALERFGLRADAPPMYQSTRGDAYAAALQQLRDDGHTFACWCSRSDLEIHGPHRDGICLTAADPSRAPAWRLRVPGHEIAFDDALQGPQRHDLRDEVGDFVLLRADGCWAYQLACTVDDAAQGISEVVRGCDLLDSTPRQILLQQLLGLPTPRYRHIPLAVDADGRKLSKSDGDLPLADGDLLRPLRAALALLGLPPAAARGHDTATILAATLAAFNPARLPRGHTLPNLPAADAGWCAAEDVSAPQDPS